MMIGLLFFIAFGLPCSILAWTLALNCYKDYKEGNL